MSKNMKKVIWCVIFGISLVSLVTGLITLLINSLSFWIYDKLCVSGLGTILKSDYHLQLRIYLTISAGLTLVFLIIQIIKTCMRNKNLSFSVLQWISLVLTLALFAVACAAMVSGFTLPPYSENIDGSSVDVNALSYFLEAIGVIMQAFISATMLIISEFILIRLIKAEAKISGEENKED